MNRVITEDDLLVGNHKVEEPSSSGKTCHLEDLWGITLSKGNFLIGQFLLEDFEGQLEIVELLEVTDRNAEGVDEHGDEAVLQAQVHSDIVGEPHDYVREGKDPNNAQHEREGVEVVVLLRERTRDCDVLSVG